MKKLFYRIKERNFEQKMKKQRYKNRFSDMDVWNWFCWFYETTPKMFEQLEKNIHGIPNEDFCEIKDMPEEWLKIAEKNISSEKNAKKFSKELINWKLILLRIAYCFDVLNEDYDYDEKCKYEEINNEYRDEYLNQVYGDKDLMDLFVVDEVDEKGKPKYYKLVTNEADPELEKNYRKREEEIAKFREDRKNEGFDLLKKYYYNLWD